MLRSLKEFERYEVDATDGAVGTVADFLIEDGPWAVRYLVAETNSYLESRKVLVSPASFREVDGYVHCFHLALSREAMRSSPGVDLHVPAALDAHQRSAKALRGYHIHGSDGEIGHVADFIVDDDTWAIRYLVVNTSNWFFGTKVLIAPHWANRVSFESREIFVEMTRASIKNSPVWNPKHAVHREYETRLYDYYGRPVYWSAEGHLLQPPQEADLRAL